MEFATPRSIRSESKCVAFTCIARIQSGSLRENQNSNVGQLISNNEGGEMITQISLIIREFSTQEQKVECLDTPPYHRDFGKRCLQDNFN